MITWLEKKLDMFLVQCQNWAIKVKQEVADVNVPQEYNNKYGYADLIKPRETYVPTATGGEYNATYVPSSSAMHVKSGDYVCPICKGIYHSSDMKPHNMLTRQLLVCLTCDNLLNTLKAEKTAVQIQSRRR